jgi:broad specificity phosphatase PhoE
MNAPLPNGLQRSLEIVQPRDAAVLLLRHADRPPLQDGDSGHEIALTETGVARSAALGQWLAARQQVGAVTSPLRRCVQTAEVALAGHPQAQGILPDRRLGHPGPFVFDSKLVGQIFATDGTHSVVRRLLAGEAIAGMRSARDATELVLGLAVPLLQSGGTHLLVTHDAILMPIVQQLCGERFVDRWLDPLDGAVLLWRGGRLQCVWQGQLQEVLA